MKVHFLTVSSSAPGTVLLFFFIMHSTRIIIFRAMETATALAVIPNKVANTVVN